MLGMLFGEGCERIPDLAFKGMALSFRVRDWLIPPAKKVDRLLLQEGMVVIDYGCGTGSYLKLASERVGTTGRIYALDVQPLAVEAARQRAETHGQDRWPDATRPSVVRDHVLVVGAGVHHWPDLGVHRGDHLWRADHDHVPLRAEVAEG